MVAYITVGATTTHGGKVISGSPQTTHNGIPISRKGDKVICKKCKKVTTILTEDASFIVDGAPIARAGDVTSCGAKLIAIQQSFCESDFEVMGVEQPAPMQFPKSDPESLFASFAAPKDKQLSESDNKDRDILFVSFTPCDNEDDAAEGTLVAGNTYAGEPNEGGGGIDRPVYIAGTAGTPEELRYQAELEAMYINVGSDETKFREGVKKIAARDMLAFDILTIPAGIAVKSAQIGGKAGQYVIKSRAQSINKTKIKNNNQIDDDLGNRPLGGAQRANQYSHNWQKASLKDARGKFAGDNPKVTHTRSGKIIHENRKTGVQVVYDREGDYFTVLDPSIKGKRKYLDLNGDVPNNKTLPNGKKAGRSPSEYREVTHFKVDR